MAKGGWNPWDPWAGDELMEFMDRMKESVRQSREAPRHGAGPFIWKPAADAVETRDAFVVQVELPGMKKADVMLEIRDGALLVFGERRQEKDVDERAFLLMERSHGPFARKFMLPRNVDSACIQAVFRDGLLTVTLPKKGGAAACKVRIEID